MQIELANPINGLVDERGALPGKGDFVKGPEEGVATPTRNYQAAFCSP